MLKKVTVCFTAFLMLCVFCVTGYARELIDMSKTGSVSITMEINGKPVSGGSITLIRVGDIYLDNGDYKFRFTDDFADCALSLDDIESGEQAENLMLYAMSKDISGITLEVDSQGKVEFKNLEIGLYLTVQNSSASGYKRITPFLVSVPNWEENRYIYDVDASPKVEIERTEETTAPTPTKPPETHLPQTGQLNWPIPVLAVSGLALLILGWILRFGKRKSTNEK